MHFFLSLVLDDDPMWIETCRKAQRYVINKYGESLCNLFGEYCELVATMRKAKSIKYFLTHQKKKTWWGDSPYNSA
jgi:hypothetical protein